MASLLAGITLLLVTTGSASSSQKDGAVKRTVCKLPEVTARVKYMTNHDGTRIQYRCTRGYSVLGDVYSTCLQGLWSNQPPICIARGCRPVYHIPGGRVVWGYGGAMVSFSCDNHHTLRGPALLICDGQNWNGTLPSCAGENEKQSARVTKPELRDHEQWLEMADYSCIKRHSSIPPPRIDHAHAYTQWGIVSGKPRLYTTYRCQLGYVSQGKARYMYCQEGQWAGGQPKCHPTELVKPSKRPRDQPDTVKMTHDDWLKLSDYTCMGSYKSPQRNEPSAPSNGYYRLQHDVIQGLPRLYATLVCDQGYHVIDDVTSLYCNENTWVGDEPQCIQDM